MQWGFALYFTAMCLSLVHLGDCREHVLPDVRPGLHQEGVLKSFCSHCCWSEQWDWRAAVFSPDDLLDKRSAPLERAQLNQRCCWTPICCCSNCCYWVGFGFFFFFPAFLFSNLYWQAGAHRVGFLKMQMLLWMTRGWAEFSGEWHALMAHWNAQGRRLTSYLCIW